MNAVRIKHYTRQRGVWKYYPDARVPLRFFSAGRHHQRRRGGGDLERPITGGYNHPVVLPQLARLKGCCAVCDIGSYESCQDIQRADSEAFKLEKHCHAIRGTAQVAHLALRDATTAGPHRC